MPLLELTPEIRMRKMRRVLIVGAPNHYKTTSLSSVPRPTAILSFPGEEGVGAIPEAPDIISRAYEGLDEAPAVIWADLERWTFEAIGGKYGPIQSFCGDGLYQLAVLALNIVSMGAFSKGEKVDPFLYPQAANRVLGYLRRVLGSPVPYAFFTAWEGKEVIDPLASVKSEAPRALYPDLPGALAKQIMGLFSVVVHCELDPPVGPGGTPKGFWRLRATPSIRSAGIKMPVEAALKLPERVPMGWKNLEPFLNYQPKPQAVVKIGL